MVDFTVTLLGTDRTNNKKINKDLKDIDIEHFIKKSRIRIL